MKIVVVGGTGLIGRPLVAKLREDGHEVVAASPSAGVDTITGEGLAEAVAGAQVVVDIPNSPSFEDQAVLDFFRTSTGNLVEAERAAGVGHHVVLSIVGADRMPNIGYMRAKIVQEDIVRDSGIPFTIVRATQFFEFIGSLAEGGAETGPEGDRIRLSAVLMQPIAALDVSLALARAAEAAPENATWELAGPEPLRLAETARRVLDARGDTRPIVTDPAVGYFGGEVTDESLVPGHDERLEHVLAPTRFEDWLAAQG